MIRKLSVVVLLLVSAACTKSGAGNRPPVQSSNNEPARITSTDFVDATPDEVTLAKGESAYAVVRVQIQNGYHINANPATYSYLKATELELTPSNGLRVEFVRYPDPTTKKFSFTENPLKVYEGETAVKAMLKADQSAEAGKHNLSAKLNVQACDDQVCYAPGTLNLTIPVTIK